MKKFITLIVTLVLCFACLSITANAALINDTVSPMYNNTASATTSFNISESGLASISVSYGGSGASKVIISIAGEDDDTEYWTGYYFSEGVTVDVP